MDFSVNLAKTIQYGIANCCEIDYEVYLRNGEKAPHLRIGFDSKDDIGFIYFTSEHMKMFLDRYRLISEYTYSSIDFDPQVIINKINLVIGSRFEVKVNEFSRTNSVRNDREASPTGAIVRDASSEVLRQEQFEGVGS